MRESGHIWNQTYCQKSSSMTLLNMKQYQELEDWISHKIGSTRIRSGVASFSCFAWLKFFSLQFKVFIFLKVWCDHTSDSKDSNLDCCCWERDIIVDAAVWTPPVTFCFSWYHDSVVVRNVLNICWNDILMDPPTPTPLQGTQTPMEFHHPPVTGPITLHKLRIPTLKLTCANTHVVGTSCKRCVRPAAL